MVLLSWKEVGIRTSENKIGMKRAFFVVEVHLELFMIPKPRAMYSGREVLPLKPQKKTAIFYNLNCL